MDMDDDEMIRRAARDHMIRNTSIMDDFPTASDVAIILCLKRPILPRARAMMRENWDSLHTMVSIDVLSEVLREFSAKYLPQLVQAYIEEGDSAHSTIYSDVLRAVSRNMYWGRFQKETELGKSVLFTHARRLARYNGRVAADHIKFGQSAMFLWQLLAWEERYDPHPLPEEQAKKLVRMIKEFRRDCPGAIGTSIGQDAMIVLEGPGPRLEDAKLRIAIQRSQWKMDIIMCHCGANHPPGRPNAPLLRCSLCKTVAYCCPAHQKADWKSHKKRCFKASWETPSAPTPTPATPTPSSSTPRPSQATPQRPPTSPGARSAADLAQDLD